MPGVPRYAGEPEGVISDGYGVVHETAGDDTLCHDYWYIQTTLRVRRGWHLPDVSVVTCFSCFRRRIAWLD